MKDLKTLLEGSLSSNKLNESSILADVEDTIKSGNKYKNVDLEMLMNAKSESEFNILYNLLKEQLVHTQKRPEIATGAFDHKFIKTHPGEFYIVFCTYKIFDKEYPSIIFGNKDTVNAYWNPAKNKLTTSWSNMGFGYLPNRLYNNEIRQLPKEWSKQISKLIIKTK